MTLDERRDALVSELNSLLDVISVYPMNTPVVPGKNPFLDELLARLREKTAELESLNAVAASAPYRFWRACRKSLIFIWAAAFLCVVFSLTVLLTPLISLFSVPGLFITLVITAVVLAWAIWVASDPF